jgi:hypothetical protein
MNPYISVKPTHAQFKKLKKGEVVQLKHHQLLPGGQDMALDVYVHPDVHKKVKKAIKDKKGIRIQLTPTEMQMNGQGFMDFWDKVKNVGKMIKDNIVDSSLYQQSVKPLVRQAVDAGIARYAPLAGPAAPFLIQGVNELGKQTGAYGLKKVSRKKKYKLQSGFQTMMGPDHPAMNPTMPYLPAIGGAMCASCKHSLPVSKPASGAGRPRKVKGGSFRMP